MENIRTFDTNRRKFLSKIVPVCAFTCMISGKGNSALYGAVDNKIEQQVKHKFDREYRRMSLRQYRDLEYREYIKLVRTLSKTFGKDKVIELIKQDTYDRMLKYGKDNPGSSLRVYSNIFKNPQFSQFITLEFVEDTEKAFELKVTECIYAPTFLKYNAGDIGYAAVCYGDYAWAKGFNPNIKLVRDKTLMEGHGICNHRYIWEG